MHTIEISKPSLAWSLSCKASELCQTLGYHRHSTMKNDTPSEEQRKIFLFWMAYYIDKSLSLRLGRASTIQDWDITAPSITEQPSTSPMAAFACLWTLTARIQGKIYELLYSPDSMAQPDTVRETRVQSLSSELEDIRKRSGDAVVGLWRVRLVEPEYVMADTSTAHAFSEG